VRDWGAQHRLIEDLFAAGLAAVEPRAAVNRALAYDGASLTISARSVPAAGRLVVVAVGKAAGTMALGARDVLGDRIDTGIILTKDGHLDSDVPGFEAYEARHPIPDERGIAATSRILDVVSGLTGSDVVLALISGGGSALLEAPRRGISLTDFQQTTGLLLRAGAPIQHLNAVRSAISQVKGGGLRRAMGGASCISLILSDVLGNDPSIIASGPTVLPTAAPGVALELVNRYGVIDRLPASVVSQLRSAQANERIPDTERDVWQIIADNGTLLEAVAREADARGLRHEIAWRDREGEARDLGAAFAHLAAQASPEIDFLIGGGEATVTVRGNGSGGRNTEFALASAIEFECGGFRDWIIASLGSDGQDGSADAAGAIADPDSVARAAKRGVSASALLNENDSARFFAEAGGLIRPGPTGTNVNDVYMAVRVR
jgi:glycerate-2-kinase